MTHKNWEGFTGGAWQEEIDVRDFIQKNYCEYKGDDSFLSTATKRTKELMKRVNTLFEVEKQFGGVLDVDTETISTSSTPPYCFSTSKRVFTRFISSFVRFVALLQKLSSPFY